MSQSQMNINDYVNFNLDNNNPSGSQMMDNLIQQMEQMPQTQPLMLSGQGQMGQPMQQPMQQPIQPMHPIGQPIQQIQPMQPMQPMQPIQPMQPMQQIQPMQQPMGQQIQPMGQTFVPTKKPSSEKEKAMKELEISSSEAQLSEKKQKPKSTPESTSTSLVPSPKSLTSNINETGVAVLLYALISNPFMTPLILKYVPFFETSPNLLFVCKVILFALIYHLVRWLM